MSKTKSPETNGKAKVRKDQEIRRSNAAVPVPSGPEREERRRNKHRKSRYDD